MKLVLLVCSFLFNSCGKDNNKDYNNTMMTARTTATEQNSPDGVWAIEFNLVSGAILEYKNGILTTTSYITNGTPTTSPTIIRYQVDSGIYTHNNTSYTVTRTNSPCSFVPKINTVQYAKIGTGLQIVDGVDVVLNLRKSEPFDINTPGIAFIPGCLD